MIDKLDKYYSSLRKQTKLQSLLRLATRTVSNLIIPVYFKLTRKKISLDETNDIIVSLTTFPQRIDKIWMVIECMARQNILPSKIILWLSQDQFPNKFKDLPQNLNWYLNNNILTINFVEDDLRSHKKYYYALKNFPDSRIIVIDDDIFYPSTLIKHLVDVHLKYPNSIACLRAYQVKRNLKGDIQPYNTWVKIIDGQEPCLNLFHTSGGGTLYKSSFFDAEVFNVEVFKKTSFTADDIWLNVMAQKNKTKTVKADYFSNLIPIFSNSFKLSKMNVLEFENDKQIKKVLDYYKIDEKDIF